MSVTFEDIKQAVGANPALLIEISNGFAKDITPILGQSEEGIKGILPILNTKGYVVRSSTDEQSFLNTYKSQIIDTEIPAKVKEVHDRYDEDLFTLTGERKAPTEKTYDFLKRKITDIKSAQIADPVIKEQLKELQLALGSKENEYKKTIEDIESKHFKKEINWMIGVALDNVNVAMPAHLKTEEEKQKYVTLQKNMMKRDMLDNLTTKKDNEGNVVFYDGEKPLTSTSDGKALKASDIIKERYGYYLSTEGKFQAGTGTGKFKADGKASFGSKEEVISHLETAGMKQGTKEFYDQYEKLSSESGLLK